MASVTLDDLLMGGYQQPLSTVQLSSRSLLPGDSFQAIVRDESISVARLILRYKNARLPVENRSRTTSDLGLS